MRPYRGMRMQNAKHAHPLVKRLLELMHEQRCTVLDMSERAGMTRTTITKWKTRFNPQLSMLEACLNVLGYELYIRKIRDRDDERPKNRDDLEPDF